MLEMDVNDEKRRKMKIGDIWKFKNANNEKLPEFNTKIIDKKIYKSFEEAIKKVGYKKLLPNCKSIEEAIKTYNAFDGGMYEVDAKKYGVDGFDFRIICKTDTIEEARELETVVLQTWDGTLYNKAPNADGASGTKRDKKVYVTGAAKRLADPQYRTRLSIACKGVRAIVTCPHCKKQGGGGNMRRYHFDNCKAKK